MQPAHMNFPSLGVPLLPKRLLGQTAPPVILPVVLFIVRPRQDYLPWFNKSAKVIHMAVGVSIKGQAERQPKDLRRDQLSKQYGLNALLGKIRVSIGIQEAFLRRQHCALPVDVEGPPFKYEIDRSAPDRKARVLPAEVVDNIGRDAPIELARPVAPPAPRTVHCRRPSVRIELPIETNESAGFVQSALSSADVLGRSIASVSGRRNS
mmetsp:Transcript_49402/g.148842  ORF Transcript_49402/g.148842 Transcript_49402/m.148842 type:complete len:208 (+) Transcript_49402:433-1056(+)